MMARETLHTAASTAPHYTVLSGGAVIGPVVAEDVRAMLAAGAITAHALVSRIDAASGYEQVHQVPELVPESVLEVDVCAFAVTTARHRSAAR